LREVTARRAARLTFAGILSRLREQLDTCVKAARDRL